MAFSKFHICKIEIYLVIFLYIQSYDAVIITLAVKPEKNLYYSNGQGHTDQV